MNNNLILLICSILINLSCYGQPTTNLSCGDNGYFDMPNNGSTSAQDPTTLCVNNSPMYYSNSDVDGDGCEDVDYSVENNLFFEFTGPAGSGCVDYDFVMTPDANQSIQATMFPPNSNTCGCTGLDGANSIEDGGGVNNDGNPITFTVTICEGDTWTLMVDGYAGDDDGGFNLTVVCPCTSPTITATSATDPICPGGSSVLTASGASTYTWSPTSTLSSSTGTSVTASPNSNTTYTVTGDDGSGCIGTTTVTVNISSPPTPDAGPDLSICNGESTTIGADPIWNVGGDTYSWDNGAGSGTLDLSGGGQDHGTATVSPTTTTTYTVTVTDGSSCSGTDQVTVTVNNLDDASFSLTDFCVGASNNASGIATPGGTFSFNPAPGDGATINGSTGEISSAVGGTTYTR